MARNPATLQSAVSARRVHATSETLPEETLKEKRREHLVFIIEFFTFLVQWLGEHRLSVYLLEGLLDWSRGREHGAKKARAFAGELDWVNPKRDTGRD